MIKLISKFFIIFFFLTQLVFAELIENIEVQGNQRVSSQTVILFSNLKIGDVYSENLINQSIKDLYETGFFNQIDIKFNNGVTVIDLIENPIIEKLEIFGIKQKSFLEFIEKELNLKKMMSYNDFLFDKDLKIIRNLLNTNGYYFSKIDSSFKKNDDLNSMELRINIDLGKKAKIKKISFIGDKFFKDKKLFEIVSSEEHKFWKFISNKVYLNRSLIELDKRLLENFYKNNGFYNVKIIDNFVELNNKDSSFNLIYNINADQKFIIKNFLLTLPEDYDKNDFLQINKIFKDNINKTYSIDLINKILNEIDKIATSNLYDFIDVKVEETISDNNNLSLNFVVSESSKFYVEQINVLGNFNTIEEVVRNELIIDEGDPLNNLLFNKSLNQIKALRIFKNVNYSIKDGSNPNLKVIDISVEEQPTGEISVAAGAGTDGVTSSAGIKEKNFLGKGINLDTNIELTEDSIKGEINYSKPNFAYTDNTLFTSIRSINNDFLTLYGYESSELGFSIGTKFEQYEKLFFSPEVELVFEDLSSNSTASNSIKKQDGNYKDLYFNYGLDYDQRNSVFDTKEGYIFSFSQNLPIYSENNELSNSLVLTNYKELNKKSEIIGKSSFYLKSINTLDGSDVRISKRLSVPYNRLRGFQRGRIGPVDGKDYIGGNYLSTLNLSTNLPNFLPTISDIIEFNYFVDLANLWGVDYNSSLDNSKIRSSTGIGMNVLTPIGPLSFSLSQPITKTSSDKVESFRFNIGTTF
jgi:outer membrane protein insertion porin family